MVKKFLIIFLVSITITSFAFAGGELETGVQRPQRPERNKSTIKESTISFDSNTSNTPYFTNSTKEDDIAKGPTRTVISNETNNTSDRSSEATSEIKFSRQIDTSANYTPTSNYVESTGWVNAKGDTIGNISGLNIAKYRIRGEGPNNTVLDWTTFNSKKIVFSNVERGIWTLYVEAISEEGEVVAKGTMKTFLSNDSPLTTIKLDEQGYGAVDCAFYWSGEQAVNPTLKIYVKDYNGNFQERSQKEISIEGNVAYWKATNIPSGSYVVRTELYDNEGIIGGSAAAMRILDHRVSTGEIEVCIQVIPNKHGIAISGVPSGSVKGSLSAKTSEDVIYFKSNEDSSVRLVYQWYLDGKQLNINENVNKIELRKVITEKGYHQIACIPAKADDVTSISTFTAIVGFDGTNFGYFHKASNTAQPTAKNVISEE